MHPGTSSCNQVHQDTSRYIKLLPSTSRCIQVHQAIIKYIKAHLDISRVILKINKNGRVKSKLQLCPLYPMLQSWKIGYSEFIIKFPKIKGRSNGICYLGKGSKENIMENSILGGSQRGSFSITNFFLFFYFFGFSMVKIHFLQKVLKKWASFWKKF